MSRSRRRGLQILIVVGVITLFVPPIGAAGGAPRGRPAPPRITIASTPPQPDGDDANVDATAAVSDTKNVSDSKNNSDFGYFTASPSTGTLSDKASGDASAKSHLDATVTDFNGNVFSDATGSATISGSASRNKQSSDLGPFIPFASGDASFDATVVVSEPTEVSISFSANGSNDDKDECTDVSAQFQADDSTIDASRHFGVSCAGHSGPSSFDGVITSGASIQVSIGATVDPEKPDSSNHYSGSFSASLSVVGICPSSPATPTTHHGIRLVDGGARAQGSQCSNGSPLTGDILYDFANGTNSDLFLLDAREIDPATPLNLTETPGVAEADAVWSPNGKQIAFDDGHQIFVMTAGGSEIQQLTTDGDNTHPAWSPDGRRIAFESDRDGNLEIYVMKDDGFQQGRLTHNAVPDFAPAWSPDGTTIAYTSRRSGNTDILTIPAAGGVSTNLTSADTAVDQDPTFAPSGSILFDTNRDGNFEIYSMGADGSNPTNLTNDPGDDVDPSVSPDGGFVVFHGDRSSGTGLFVMPIGGGTASQLTIGGASPDWGQSACTFYGTAGPDTFTGDGRLCGGPGDDHLTGGVEADTLDGGPGDDTLKVSDGLNTIFGGAGNDEIVGGKTLDQILGGPGDDAIFGNGGNDILQGGPGNDSISGGAGGDDIQGDEGHDKLFGGPGNDTITDGPGGDTPGPGHPGAGVFAGPGNDTLDACNGVKDTIDGELGTDTATIDKGTDVTTHVEVKNFC